jgi:hypothetical protein
MMENNGKKSGWMIAAVALLAMLGSAQGIAFQGGEHDGLSQLPLPACPSEGGERPTPSGGGGNVPDPLAVYNEHVELADGEYYLLVGRIRIAPALQGSSRKLQAYLAVDLKAHPWLANKKRRDFALYPIEGSVAAWKSYEGMRVKLAARARSQALVLGHGQDTEILQILSLVPFFEGSTIPWRD